MNFEWDEDKNESNLRKHGVDFIRAKEIFNGPILERIDPGHHRETRWHALGTTEGRILFVVYIMRGDVCRIISARKADKHETQSYYNKIFG